ncbi:hypothetical protein NE237_029462 [Protea cynaroides]|uniref:Uncharacterized protein n=1 Tax=Protea cynaroides TaxID=273540 RepID=A0A9Q0GUB3_9MAGN|nr:hypothetical protein NE237_029462 [Protea cynaroides]
MRVKRGSSATVYLDNVACKDFLHSKFPVSIIDMKRAVPFISLRALHDIAREESVLTQCDDNQEKSFALIHVLARFIKYTCTRMLLILLIAPFKVLCWFHEGELFSL